jgi:WD40 repeat protein
MDLATCTGTPTAAAIDVAVGIDPNIDTSDEVVAAGQGNATPVRKSLRNRSTNSATVPHGIVPPSGAVVVTYKRDGKLSWYDAVSQELLWTAVSRDIVPWSIYYSSMSNRIVARMQLTKRLVVWDLSSGATRTLAGTEKHYVAVIDRAGARVLTCRGDLGRMWDLETGAILFDHRPTPYIRTTVHFINEDTRFVSCHANTDITVWDAVSGAVMFSIRERPEVADKSAVSSCGQMLAVAGRRTISVVVLDTGQMVFFTEMLHISNFCFGKADATLHVFLRAEGAHGSLRAFRIIDGELLWTVTLRGDNDNVRNVTAMEYCPATNTIFTECWLTCVNKVIVCEISADSGEVVRRSDWFDCPVNRIYVAPPITVLL